MDYSPRHARSYRLRYYEMDDYGEATAPTMMSLFEETAFSHVEATGRDVYQLRDDGYGWILLEGALSMRRYPRNHESFSVETWLAGVRGFYGSRGFAVKDERGETIGEASSLWVFFDLARKRPAPVLQYILDAWKPDPAVLPARRALGGASAATPSDEAAAMAVRSSDIDTNGHVNNVRYLEWALEAVPQEMKRNQRLASMEGRFVRSVMMGERVTPVCLRSGEAARSSDFGLAVYASRPDEQPATGLEVAACALTRWEPRSSPAA